MNSILNYEKSKLAATMKGWLFLGFLSLTIGLILAYLTYVPSLEVYQSLLLPGKYPPYEDDDLANGEILVSFCGVATLLLQTQDSAVMVDGFFTRPGFIRSLFYKIQSNKQQVTKALRKLGIKQQHSDEDDKDFVKLLAVMPIHSHFDHALDTPAVSELTGAPVIGSNSTANIARGYGIPEEKIIVLKDDMAYESHLFGDFNITFIPSAHSPNPVAPGKIDEPLKTPAGLLDFAMGACYSILFQTANGKSILVHGSAGYVEGFLSKPGIRADVIYLGVSPLGKASWEERENYWREVVLASGAKRVIIIHYDDFTKPLPGDREGETKLLDPLPLVFDRFDEMMNSLLHMGKRDQVEIRVAPLWNKINPYCCGLQL